MNNDFADIIHIIGTTGLHKSCNVIDLWYYTDQSQNLHLG